MKISFIIIILCLSIVANSAIVENKIYWVQFNTKYNTPFTINKPNKYLSQRAIERRARHQIAIDSTDLPVNPNFIDSLTALGFYVKHTSRWMNAAIVILPDTININSLVRPSFVSSYQIRKEIQYKSLQNKFSDPDYQPILDYGSANTQIAMLNGHILHQQATGKGVTIAVIDAGFKNADKFNVFDSIYARGGILGTRDFINPGNNVYNEFSHGAAVLSIMASKQPGTLIGSAPDADYWLLRTEDVNSEYPIEEDYWIIAAEFADSAGCDVINTSLGYNTFDNPVFDHTYAEFDGQTMRISQAANLAVEKGIVVVCSAGNSGDDPWRYIVAPSEAKNVLSIAAVNSVGDSVSFSSSGFPSENALMKPDVSAMGAGVSYISSTTYQVVSGNGTSFSSPLIAGMAACLVELYPQKTAFEINDLIRSCANRFPLHDVKYGFGIPNFALLFDTTNAVHHENIPSVSAFPNPFNNNLKISYSNNYRYFTLYSALGEKILTSTLLGNQTEFSSSRLSNLDKGVYFAVFSGNSEVRTIKLIKQ